MPALAAVPRWAWVAVGGVVLLVVFYLMLDAYGDSRYRQGKTDADAAWAEASSKVIQKAQDAEVGANKVQAAEAAEFALKVQDEKEAIANAQANGSSPFDVMFGNGS